MSNKYQNRKSNSKVDSNKSNVKNQYRSKRSRTTDTEPSRSGAPVDVTKPSSFNDIEWYVHSTAEMDQIGSLAYAQATGLPVSLYGKSFRIPGIAAFDVHPTYGSAYSGDAALNLAARNLYAKNRAMNSGAANYNSVEYMFYNIAMDSLYYMISHVKRALRAINVYSSFNRYVPMRLLAAMGFEYDDLTSHLPQYVARLNAFIRRANTFKVGDYFPIFKRHSFMFGQVMMDSTSPKSQFYLYRPAGYYVYTLGDNGLSKLEWRALNYENVAVGSVNQAANLNTYTFDFWMGQLELILSRIIEHEPFQIMNGDTIKAFGDSVYTISEFQIDEPLDITLDEEVRLQLMNATIIPDFEYELTEYHIDASRDFYIEAIGTYGNKNLGQDIDCMTHLLNSFIAPNPKVNIEITRLMIPMVYSRNATDAARVEMEELGSEVIVKGVLLTSYNRTDGITDPLEFKVSAYSFVNVISVDDPFSDPSAAMFQTADLVSEFFHEYMQFDYAPRCIPVVRYLYDDGTSDDPIPRAQVGRVISRTDHWTTIDRDTLNSINKIAITKLLGF